MGRTLKVSQKLSENLKKLHLPGISEYWKQITENAVKNSWSYEEYLLSLLEEECQSRYNRRVERLKKASNLDSTKTMERFDFKRLPLKINQQVKALLDGNFLDRAENVLVFGQPGSGKTHIISAIAHEMIKKNRKMLFTTCSILVQELLQAKKELELPKMLKKMSKYDGIIIDDIGYVQQSREEMEVLFTFLSDRYERGSILLTSNLPFSKWDQIFKDSMITAAAVDRLVHHSIIIEMNLNSFRMEDAKKKRKKK
jgi:DNA replication protein DnaC